MPKTNGEATESRFIFGRRLREERRRREMTLEELDEVSGLSWNYIAQIERGERNIGIDNMHRLAAGVGVPLGKLFES